MLTQFWAYEKERDLEYMGGYSSNSETCIKDALSTMRKLGPKKSLTQLNIHHWASEIVRSEEYGHRDHAGLPSQMFRYALGLVTTISDENKPITII
jgi:hypothetical protein